MKTKAQKAPPVPSLIGETPDKSITQHKNLPQFESVVNINYKADKKVLSLFPMIGRYPHGRPTKKPGRFSKEVRPGTYFYFHFTVTVHL